ncbi:lytic polysaccharide monooxygenase [Lentithecium fluviatile CBS 122367]|uniref:lytic cellulose monooxygenase (C4-dehydrogenating) n=1 Tax=Lentithecium fluviatile CBS 122367 TaxID=1168545 RepID=A0A6G1IT96_9PLEO|nr:lytic polysaccharide monooxygenase [Lentithecium fluviatile CBS 122367]
MVCGRNATRAWNRPKTARIRAGAKVGFAPGEPMLPADDYDTPRIYHQGIASAWLSKSPVDDLNTYRGDGDWFKIMSVLEPTEQSIDWALPENKKHQWNFTIPATTPPGKYLLRFEHIYPNPGPLGAQFYPNCAHVEIFNERTNVGQPGPLVKIPGVYVWGQPGE